jgi:UV DNA damage endonuclease
MNIGYACLAVGVPDTEIKGCILKNATEERLLALIEHNLMSLHNLITYNNQNGIRLFRISSDLIPFGSSVAADLPWPDAFADRLVSIGQQISKAGLRVSMHPGQYTVLNSPDPGVVERAILDLEYHAKVLDHLGLGPNHKIILHLGGAYGDKIEAKRRFIQNYKGLASNIRSRLILENDDSLYTIGDILEVAAAAGMPVVFDNLHHAVNPPEQSRPDSEWIKDCAATWQAVDGVPKIHYSQQQEGKKPGAHSETIQIDVFLDYCQQMTELDVDIMLEVKDKNRSALKCINSLASGDIRRLEAEWARYKYGVLEHDPAAYQAIRQLLRDKQAYPALTFYRWVEQALDKAENVGHAVNAAQHVWGYFKDKASESEKKRFQSVLQHYIDGDRTLSAVKQNLFTLAQKYRVNYLLNSYYF